MRITKTLLDPSREDAVRLKRQEKAVMLLLMNAVETLEAMSQDLAGRLGMVESGPERARKLAEDANLLLQDLRVTVPEEQRFAMENIGKDMEMRLVPKLAPSDTSMLVARKDYQLLVDSARVRCAECAEDDNTCQQCDLYRLLTSILPLDGYHNSLLCPYNMARWKK